MESAGVSFMGSARVRVTDAKITTLCHSFDAFSEAIRLVLGAQQAF